jgi:hypothetical protein
MIKLFSLVTGPKERVKYFNQMFTMVLNKFKYETMPTHELQIEAYANALLSPISIFVKRVGKITLH